MSPGRAEALTGEDMAALAGMKYSSFKSARSRGRVPDPDFMGTDGRPRWNRSTANAWAVAPRRRRGPVVIPAKSRGQAPKADPVGLADIATRGGFDRSTVRHWHSAGEDGFPPPRWYVSGSPAWDWQYDVRPWLAATGRLR